MNENFNYFFQYLEKEEITIDKPDFIFQLQSHPDYPSLLSISDTLSFFNIDNGVIKVQFSEIDLLPNRFVLLLNKEGEKPQLYFIEKRNENWYYTQNNKLELISKSDLEKRWGEVVLLVEKTNEIEKSKLKNQFSWILPSLSIFLFLLLLFFVDENWHVKLFFMFPLIGIVFSIGALKDLFGTKSELLTKFCNITTSTNCTTVVSSNKWKIFKYISFSDLSIVFFSFQFLGLFWFTTIGESANFLLAQKILLLVSIPVLLASLYYQKFIEKKWCPICLVIIGIIVFEICYLLIFQENEFSFSLIQLLLFGFIFIVVYTLWTALKSFFLKQKKLKDFQIMGNRFMKNYSIFKNTLLSKPKVNMLQSPIILGNKESCTEITIITNPFCGYCEQTHQAIKKILHKHGNNLKVNIIIKVNINYEDEDNKLFFRNLTQLYFEKGEIGFEEGMSYWFKNKNIKDFNKIYKTNFNFNQIDAIYDENENWCIANGYNYTPAIFMNGYEYPKEFSRDNFELFLNELIEDINF